MIIVLQYLNNCMAYYVGRRGFIKMNEYLGLFTYCIFGSISPYSDSPLVKSFSPRNLMISSNSFLPRVSILVFGKRDLSQTNELQRVANQ
jgi:hypothetical protein